MTHFTPTPKQQQPPNDDAPLFLRLSRFRVVVVLLFMYVVFCDDDGRREGERIVGVWQHVLLRAQNHPPKRDSFSIVHFLRRCEQLQEEEEASSFRRSLSRRRQSRRRFCGVAAAPPLFFPDGRRRRPRRRGGEEEDFAHATSRTSSSRGTTPMKKWKKKTRWRLAT